VVLVFQDIGKRDNQEDAYYVDEEKGLFIVCDGVGGYADGEVASQSVIRSISAYFDKNDIHPICTNCIINAIKFAQNELNKISSDQLDNGKNGTTIALLFYQDGKAITAHMGDSRIMLLKENSKTIWTTKDHSLVQELFDANILKSEAEMLNHPMRNKITNAIFSGQDAENLQITTHDLRNISKGDTFLIFTDGILEVLTPDDMIPMINNNSDAEAMSLITDLVKGHTSDNSTLLLLGIG